MKRRGSFQQAKGSVKRAESYKKDCEEILYRNRTELQIEGNDVYILANDEKKFLLQITNPKTTWFEIWLKLANR